MKIKKVTILGANGTMGCNVAGIFASFGDCCVYMVSRTKEKSEQAIERAVKSVRADSIRSNMIAKDYSELGEVLASSDLIFESVAERKEIKEQVLRDIAKFVKYDAIICTGTSGLSIGEMAENLPQHLKGNYLGMHFFNPPYNMSLCEIVPSVYTEENVLDFVQKYAEQVLRRTTVKVKDRPAFIGNRIGFFLINMAIQYAEKYQERGGVDYIDSIIGPFTGRNMPLIRTADFVGLDIHKAIVDNLYQNTKDYRHSVFKLPQYVETLVQEGKVGHKVAEGLYKTIREDGKKLHYVYDISTGEYRNIIPYQFDFVDNMISCIGNGLYVEAMNSLIMADSEEAFICKRFLVEYVAYSLYINREVSESVFAADDAMATGFSWLPPLALIDLLGGKQKFKELAEKTLLEEEFREYHISLLLMDVEKSKYDYRKFLKAKY